MGTTKKRKLRGGSTSSPKEEVIIYDNGDEYEGQIKNGKKHGKGVMTYGNGDVYDGEWEDNKYHGKGIYKFYIIKAEYDGEWKNGKREGKGKITYANNDVYDGEWENDKKSGKGIYIFNNKAKYDGYWVNNERHGKGIYIFNNKDVYDGDWVNDKREGQGVMTYADGDVCKGEWKDNNPLGKYTFVSGEVLRGEWKEITNNGVKQQIFTELHKPTESLSRNKTMKRISFKMKGLIHTKRRSDNKSLYDDLVVNRFANDLNFLNLICPDSGECMMFGIEIGKIKKFFNNFYSFDFMKSHKNIGSGSNGFVYELEYERKEYEKKYQSYAVLKSARDNKSDNLFYEAFVGVYINKLCVRFPCFMETYGSLVYNNIGIKTSLYKKLSTIKSVKKGEFTDGLTLFSECNKYSHFLNNHDIVVSGNIPNSFAVLVQHINNAETFYDHFNSSNKYIYELITILYQIYSVLSILSENFTHYDLHQGNILLYSPLNTKFIRMNYHYADEVVVSFNTFYIPKIIDYGRCYFRDNETNISSDTFKTKIDSLKINSDSYSYLPKKYDIVQDLKLFSFIDKSTKLVFDDELFETNFYKFLDIDIIDNYSVPYAHDRLKLFVQSLYIQSKSDEFPADKFLGTMDIYLDGSERPMKYTPAPPSAIPTPAVATPAPSVKGR